VQTPDLATLQTPTFQTVCYAFEPNMGGLLVDIYVEFLYRMVAGLLKRRRSRTWPNTKAEVMSSQCPKATYGFDVAEIYYKYRVNDELYVGIHEKGFVSHTSGEDYAANYAPGREIKIRYKPEAPSVSVVLEEDQTK
jgi:hypothetical protein